jgi:NADPH-dependent 2,4-dienoyl-CoA reductase/sulfur reductase-like enzyme
VHEPTVVVGASLAGLRAVETLRREGDDGPIVVIGAEPHMPYDRPPLSKRALTDPEADVAALASLAVPEDLGAEWVLGSPATGLDLERRRVLVDGGDIAFSRLVIATGARPRTLPAAGDLDAVHVLRSLDDSIALRRALAAGPAVAVIGAGFIGLEVASSCHQLGLDVTVIEALPVPLERAVGAAMGERIAARHRDAGIRVETGVGVASLDGAGSVEAVRLADGRVVPADVVVVGIGVAPEVAWLAGSGVDLADGVSCDSRLRVLAGGRPVPGVVAAGDVARWAAKGGGGSQRAEHWTNAVEQGEAAARTLLHGDDAAPFDPVAYFWSDQLGAKLQMVGQPRPDDDVAVVDDDGTGRWVAAYGRDGTLVAALGVSRAGKVMALRRQIEAGGPWPPQL